MLAADRVDGRPLLALIVAVTIYMFSTCLAPGDGQSLSMPNDPARWASGHRLVGSLISMQM